MQLSPSARRGLRWSAYANFALGIGVAFAAVVWADTRAATIFGVVIGVLVAATAVFSVRIPDIRIVNVALALLLCASMWIVPQGVATDMWLNALAGLGILVITLGVTTDPRGSGARDEAAYPDDEIGLGASGPELHLYPVASRSSPSASSDASP